MNYQTEKFLDLYRQLEVAARQKYFPNMKDSSSIMYALARRKEMKEFHDEIFYCIKVRNLLSHYPKVDGEYIVTPSEQLLASLSEVIERITDPPTALKLATKRNKMLSADLSDSVLTTIKRMSDKGYSHVAILERERVVGVFSENTIFTHIAKAKQHHVADDTTLSAFQEHLALENHVTECFDFVAEKTPLEMLDDLFRKKQGKKRMAMLFVTDHGAPNEQVLGILTPWDIL